MDYSGFIINALIKLFLNVIYYYTYESSICMQLRTDEEDLRYSYRQKI